MGCTHPPKMTELIRRADDGTQGLRCRQCGTEVYEDDDNTTWAIIKRATRRWLRSWA